jgi:hypothetical protein
LEYASEVWDNCGQTNSDRLEKVQLEAARIVTGLPSFASTHSIDLNKSLFRELHLFLSLACNTLRYQSPKEKQEGTVFG